MELGPYIKERLPGVIRGITEMVAANIGKPPPPADPTPQFMEKRLAILSRYQDDLKELEDVPAKNLTNPTRTAECPYCHLEELAGIIRNHLLFVAQECKEDDLAPATGGMIPKAKTTTEEFIRNAERLEAPNHIKLVTQLAVMKAQELIPRLEWIHNCEEAREAATIADEMWHRAAKATQMYYAETPDMPYA